MPNRYMFVTSPIKTLAQKEPFNAFVNAHGGPIDGLGLFVRCDAG